jgi:uncharacterized protein YyaL (SSP411 family)
MVGLTLHPYLLDEGIEPEKSTMAEGFVQVLERLELEYDLHPDIWAVAEDVLQALKTRETNSEPSERPRSQSKASAENAAGQ